MATKKTSKKTRKVESKPITRSCPFIGGPCARGKCALWHRAKKKKYSRCAFAEIAAGINNLGFRLSELASDEEEEEVFEDEGEE
jgi:hypothetical protein